MDPDFFKVRWEARIKSKFGTYQKEGIIVLGVVKMLWSKGTRRSYWSLYRRIFFIGDPMYEKP